MKISNLKFQISNSGRGFTLIELIVVIAIVAILSGIILFSVTQYISKGRDSNISGSLAILVPAGEAYYNFDNTYDGFCDSDVVANTVSQMPGNVSGACFSTSNPSGVCCSVAENGRAWAACATEFSNANYAYCVDSRGVKKEVDNSYCVNNLSAELKCQ